MMEAWWLPFLVLLYACCGSNSETAPRVRLAGGNYHEGGFVEVWRNSGWGALCDTDRSTWNLAGGDVVCRELGFLKAQRIFFGDSNIAVIPRDVPIVSKTVDCLWEESSLENCSIDFTTAGGLECGIGNVVSVLCLPESKSACGFGTVPFLGSCYSVVSDKPSSFASAQQECRKMKAANGEVRGNLVEINSALENHMVARLLEVTPVSTSLSFWTGGVVNPGILGSKFKIWHGSQKQISWDNELQPGSAGDRPEGIALNPDNAGLTLPWETMDLEIENPFICEFPQKDIGCLADNDLEGLKYDGAASHDKDGNKCIPWNTMTDSGQTWTHSFCRNPDEYEKPYCYVESEEPSDCNIYACGAIPKSKTDFSDLCPIPKNSVEGNVNQAVSRCAKEEFACEDGSCISKDYVCDGTKDCQTGEDENGCRILSSLYKKEAGFRLVGVSAESEDDVVTADLETCAKLCLYERQVAGAGCCKSFSHRPAKDGKKDLCILSSVYNNQAFDSLVQKRSWDYYSLNSSQPRNCRVKRPIGPLPIEGLRLTNPKKGLRIIGQILEVKIQLNPNQTGEWGGVCDDGFNINEGNVVCRQLGFPLGAKRVVKKVGKGVINGKIAVDSVTCKGAEKSFADCDIHMGKGGQTCSPDQMVGVECKEREETCENSEYHCASGECIGIEHLCDGISGGRDGCRDGSDEAPVNKNCDLPTQVRLTQPGGRSGLLEVRHKGVWGSVCSDHFGQAEADVFCKMLGYDSPGAAWDEVEEVAPRRGSWPIWITFYDADTCSGKEDTIEQCLHKKEDWYHSNVCAHHEDIVLNCKDDDIQHNIVLLDADLASRSQADFQTRQIVENCGLWRKTDNRGRTTDGEDVPRIAGGVAAEHGSLPWQASIRLRGPNNRTYHHCGAVVVSPYHMLTTAHCLWDYRAKLEIYYVRVGDNIIEVEDVGEQEFNIDKVDFHEQFGVGPYLNNDIAVVHIKQEGGRHIRFDNYVGPACLPPTDLAYTPQLKMKVSGWGKNSYDLTETTKSGTNFVSQLNVAEVPVIPRTICQREEVYGQDKLSSGMFCAGLLEGGLDTCQGDSGGPGVSLLPLGLGGEVRATLVGLTSWGYGCGRANKPGVYTRVSKYVPWIYQKVSPDN